MVLLFDIGGTNTRISISRDQKTFETPVVFSTPQDFSVGIKKITEEFYSSFEISKVKSVVGCIAGPINKEKTMIVTSPNLSNWIRKPLVSALADEFHAEVLLENDGDLVGLGEAVFGAGKGEGIVGYMTVSTGVGGGRIVSGRIDHSTMGFEPGHQIIDMKNNLESLVSGSALFEKHGKRTEDIVDKDIWKEVAQTLSYGVHNTIVHWSPDVMVLGGSLMNKIDIDQVRNGVDEILTIFPAAPKIRRAELGAFGGLWGGLALSQS